MNLSAWIFLGALVASRSSATHVSHVPKEVKPLLTSSSQATPSSQVVPAPPQAPQCSPPQQALLRTWYKAAGRRRAGETFPELITRMAMIQLEKPYAAQLPWKGQEVLECSLDSFDCVTFIESSLAAARCVWKKSPTAPCFLKELEHLRYRYGHMEGYASRLHYFEDWLADNTLRDHVRMLTASVGGLPAWKPVNFMTQHARLYPALADPTNKTALAVQEQKISQIPKWIVMRAQLNGALPYLQSGDIFAIVSDLPGLLITHTGFIKRDSLGKIHLLHASDASKEVNKVVLSSETLTEYMDLNPTKRKGLMLARPLAPIR